MYVQEKSEIRELTATELDHVSGGLGALMRVTWMGGFFDVAKDALIYAISVADDCVWEQNCK